MDIETRTIGSWVMPFTRERRIMSASAVAQGRQLIERWVPHAPREDTWVAREWGVASLLVRLDCVVDQDGVLRAFEVEERPGGVGQTVTFNSDFQERLDAIRRSWPAFTVVRSPLRTGDDDVLWVATAQSVPDTGLVLVRAEPQETEFHPLVPRSVSSVVMKGDKSYGVALGLWREVTSSEELPWTERFVLKPCQGSKARGVEIWDLEKKQRRRGASRAERIRRVLADHGRMYCQPFIEPMESGSPEYPFMIYRVFWGFDPTTRTWDCLGGYWQARDELKIHGARNTVNGPVVIGE